MPPTQYPSGPQLPSPAQPDVQPSAAAEHWFGEQSTGVEVEQVPVPLHVSAAVSTVPAQDAGLHTVPLA